MQIRNMFAEDINRQINGVIKVNQDDNEVIDQEVKEYVITKELKKHFVSFFDFYSEAFNKPTADIGVWISGFFGSGKSHFLKMLSYILENRPVCGTTTVEMFRKKFEDDPGTFMLIDNSTRGETETILFNIDIEGSINKDKTAVLRVFAKMFYNHLGFYGENLKVALLEQYIDQMGKTEEFRRVFAEKKGKPWLEQRKAFAFNGKAIVPTLMEVLDMSEEDAKNWFADKSSVEFSIARLVEDIKSYIDSKPKNYRLLFMVDEVGQYVGTDTDMLINLQSIIEQIGSQCGGKVWVACTGQEAIDEIIKVRSDEFSRIQARFKTRLSLSSSSVDEVIQKRILKKKPEAEQGLVSLYGENDSVLRNLFTFKDSMLDIKGFSGASEFSANFPFVPYQFILMQKVFAEIRKHGNSGKHLSGGERSMLSGFQEAAQKVQDKDEFALVPFYRFYDTVNGFLDSSIRRVIERCDRAADDHLGIEKRDVDVLKLLYLIRYVSEDIPANVENIAILMSDDIRTDKIVLREQVKESLDRLFSQNYIGRSGNTYNFLTDEEQDIQRDINNTPVDTASIVEHIGNMVFADIYTSKKFSYGKYVFPFDQMVDGVNVGPVTGGMKLRLLTAATEPEKKADLTLLADSAKQAIVVLSDEPYYETIERAMKIRKYVKQRNISQLPKSVQDIIRAQQEQAGKFETEAKEKIETAIKNAAFYVDGEHIEIKSGTPKEKIDQALEYLVAHVYSELNLITKNAESDTDILAILAGNEQSLPGMEPNRDAAAKVEEYLIIQDKMKLPTSMADVQSRYKAIPYGWREIDIAAVVAQLIYDQKVTIKYGGATIQPDNPRLPDMLRKQSEIGKTSISKRQVVTITKMKAVKELLREYLDVMDVPDDEDGLVAFIVTEFNKLQEHYKKLTEKYTSGKKYPDRDKVDAAFNLTVSILSQRNDNIALIDRMLKEENNLFDSKEDMQGVESFFKSQVQVFDEAVQLEQNLRNELDYFANEAEVTGALNQIRLITQVDGKFKYNQISGLKEHIAKVSEGHDRLLAEKRKEILDTLFQCRAAVIQAGNNDTKISAMLDKADKYFESKQQMIKDCNSLALLDGLIPQMIQYKEDTCNTIELLLTPPKPVAPKPVTPTAPAAPKKLIKPYNRQLVFPAKQLESEADIDAYVEGIRDKLKQMLKNCDGIQLK